MGEQIMIKKLNKIYIKDIINLHKLAIFPVWNKLNRKYTIKGIKKFVIEVFDKGEVFGYFNNKELVGVIGIEKRNNNLEVGFLLVNPLFHGRRIGKKLMLFIEKNFKNINKISLDVLTKNPAVNFYKKIGYKIIKEKNKKYIMEKFLK